MNPDEIPELYEEKRRKGENDSYICELIRTDNVGDFTINTTKKKSFHYQQKSIHPNPKQIHI